MAKSKKRNIVFDSDVEVDSLKDAVWRLTTRMYLLEDFIAEKFGEVLGPSGFSKVNSASDSEAETREESVPNKATNKRRKRTRRRNNARIEANILKKPKTQLEASASVIEYDQDSEAQQQDDFCPNAIKDEAFSDGGIEVDDDDVFPLFNINKISENQKELSRKDSDEEFKVDKPNDHTVKETKDQKLSVVDVFTLNPSSQSVDTNAVRTQAVFTNNDSSIFNRKCFKTWKVFKNFDTQKEAEEFIKAEKIWSVRHRYKTGTGTKHLYRCNQVKKRTTQCPMAAYILYYANSDNATMFVTDTEHKHPDV